MSAPLPSEEGTTVKVSLDSAPLVEARQGLPATPSALLAFLRMYIWGLSECIHCVQRIPWHPQEPLAPRYPHASLGREKNEMMANVDNARTKSSTCDSLVRPLLLDLFLHLVSMKLSTAQAWGPFKTGRQATMVNFVYKGKCP